MRYAYEHPEQCGLPDHRVMGPDPEPIGHRHDLPLLAAAWRRRFARPQSCPLAVALGNDTPCIGADCLYFGVPGVPVACAVEHWAPAARGNPSLSRWFLDRRRESAGAAVS
jgi:hypothetical protein